MESFFSGLYVIYILVALFVLFALVARAPIMGYRVRKKIFAEPWIEANKFYEEWPTKGGLRDNDCLGVYMLLVFDHPVTDGNYSDYENVFVGPDKYVYIQARVYHKDDVDRMERTLAGSLKAEKSYNAEK